MDSTHSSNRSNLPTDIIVTTTNTDIVAQMNNTLGTTTAGYFNHPFLFDCDIHAQELTLYIVQLSFLIINLCLFLYFSHKLCRKTSNIATKYKVVLTACNFLFTIQSCTVLFHAWSWFSYKCYNFYGFDDPYQAANITTFSISYNVGIILVFWIFTQRLEDALKNSSMEVSKRIKIIFKCCTVVLVLLSMLDVCLRLIAFNPHWVGQSYNNRTFWIVLNLYLISPTYLTTMLLFAVSSLIAIYVFIFKFKELLTMISYADIQTNMNSKNSIYKQRYGKYLFILNRTTLMACIALGSTVFFLILTIIWDFTIYGNDEIDSKYLYMYNFVISSADGLINVFCINLQYSHGDKMYKALRCYKLQSKMKYCLHTDSVSKDDIEIAQQV